jgi:TonB-dependent SusC/RagA subfamily outer membrane receptor
MNRYLIVGLVALWASPVLAQTVTPVVKPPPPPSTMRTTEVARSSATSLAQLLQGRLSGVTVSPAPDGGIIVRMGGPTSFFAGQGPLFVVDGVPVETNGTLSWLNPEDVESIQALKDPSQTAIYGVRGANGVILVRTKGSH